MLLRHDPFDLGTLDAGMLLRETVDNFFDGWSTPLAASAASRAWCG